MASYLGNEEAVPKQKHGQLTPTLGAAAKEGLPLPFPALQALPCHPPSPIFKLHLASFQTPTTPEKVDIEGKKYL